MLVLDNAEHLPDLSALLERLLDAAPSLHLLVTSRERLRNAREWLLPLQGLAVPDEDSRDLEAASSFDAVRLFEARALAAQHGFRLDAHLQAVIEIVEAVGGMPLAIELAANWVRLLPPAEIARELNESIDLLERDPSAAAEPARPDHSSLRAVLDYSWQALAPLERLALADLAVFRGGFARASASAVASVSMPLLSSLADRSLLAVDERGRFSMHPLVASFAAQRAAEVPQRRATMAAQHAEYFARILDETSQTTGEQAQAAALRIDTDYANVMVAWQQAVRSRRADLVCAMVRALWPYFESRGRVLEAFEQFRPALDLPESQPMSARALTWLRQALAMLHSWRGENEQGLALAEAGIASGERCGDPEALIGALIIAATCQWKLGQFAPAKARCVRAVAQARHHGDRNCLAWALNALGTLEDALGEWDAAIESLGGALAIDRELGRLDGMAQQLNNLGTFLCQRGRWAEARPLLDEGLRLAVTSRHARIEVYLRKNLGTALHRLGDGAAALTLLQAAAARGREMGMHQVAVAAERELAHVALSGGDLGIALQGLRAAVASSQRHDQAAEGAKTLALFGDWLVAAGDPARAAAVWRAVAPAQALTLPLRDELEGKWRAAPQIAAEPSTLDEVLRLLASTQVPPARPR
jgi:predicted ATPase